MKYLPIHLTKNIYEVCMLKITAKSWEVTIPVPHTIKKRTNWKSMVIFLDSTENWSHRQTGIPKPERQAATWNYRLSRTENPYLELATNCRGTFMHDVLLMPHCRLAWKLKTTRRQVLRSTPTLLWVWLLGSPDKVPQMEEKKILSCFQQREGNKSIFKMPKI